MAQTIKLKRSASQSAVPTTSALALGEMAINTFDGKIFIKRDNGTDDANVVEIGYDKLPLAGGTLTGDLQSTGLYVGATNTSYDFYNNGTTYLNGTTTLDDTTNISSGNLQIGGTNVINSGRAMYNLESFKMADAKKVYFGSSNDLEIYHDGGNSYIKNNTSQFYVLADYFNVKNNANNKLSISTAPSDTVKLYFNGNEKLGTTNTGINVTGIITADGLTVTKSGQAAIFTNASDADLLVDLTSGVTLLSPTTGTLDLGTSSTRRVRINSSGIDVTGTITADGLTFGSNHRIQGTGGLFIGGSSATVFEVGAGTEKMRLTSTGLGIGTTSPDCLLDVTTTSGWAEMHLDGASGGDLIFKDNGVSYGEIYAGAGHGMVFKSYASQDMHFLTNANATAKMTIKSGGNVGIGTTSPQQNFVVAEGTNQHGIELVPGTLSYIQAYDRATSAYGNLKIDALSVVFGTNNGTTALTLDTSQNATFAGTITSASQSVGTQSVVTTAPTSGSGYPTGHVWYVI